MPKRRVWIPALIVLAGVLVAGLLYNPLHWFQGATSYQQVCPSAPAPGQPVPAAQPFDAHGAAYAGDPPHPVAVIDQTDNGVLLHGGTVNAGTMPSGVDGLTGFDVPADWHAASTDTSSATNRSQVQLVACVYFASPTSHIVTCSYSNSDHTIRGTLDLLSSTYTVVVEEAKTAQTVDTFNLASADASTVNPIGALTTGQDGCPAAQLAVNGVYGSSAGVLQPLNSDFLDGLRPLVLQQL